MANHVHRKAKSKSKNAIFYNEVDKRCIMEFSIPGESGFRSIAFSCEDVPSLEKLFASLQNVSAMQLDCEKACP